MDEERIARLIEVWNQLDRMPPVSEPGLRALRIIVGVDGNPPKELIVSSCWGPSTVPAAVAQGLVNRWPRPLPRPPAVHAAADADLHGAGLPPPGPGFIQRRRLVVVVGPRRRLPPQEVAPVTEMSHPVQCFDGRRRPPGHGGRRVSDHPPRNEPMSTRARRNIVTSILAVTALILGAVAVFTASYQPATEAVSTGAAEATTTDPGPSQAEVDTLNRKILDNELDRQEWNTVVWVNATNFDRWVDETEQRLAAEQLARTERAAAERAERNINANPSGGGGRCGGNLPPCCVMQRESGGDITAQNPSSSASGKWQFIASTWNGYGGYAEAYLAPESVQDAKAAELWAGGAGAGHWGGGC